MGPRTNAVPATNPPQGGSGTRSPWWILVLAIPVPAPARELRHATSPAKHFAKRFLAPYVAIPCFGAHKICGVHRAWQSSARDRPVGGELSPETVGTGRVEAFSLHSCDSLEPPPRIKHRNGRCRRSHLQIRYLYYWVETSLFFLNALRLRRCGPCCCGPFAVFVRAWIKSYPF